MTCATTTPSCGWWTSDLPISRPVVLPGTCWPAQARLQPSRAVAQSETFFSVPFARHGWCPTRRWPQSSSRVDRPVQSRHRQRRDQPPLYGLEVLVPSINTDGDNTTRFIVLSREKPTAGNRFSLLFTLDNKPGKLAEVIQVIGRFGYDMESIKSRPLPHVPFDYYFYVELVGDPSADKTAALLRELDHTCRTVRLLGVYTK